MPAQLFFYPLQLSRAIARHSLRRAVLLAASSAASALVSSLQIFLDSLSLSLDHLRQLLLREVPLTVVHRLELAAITATSSRPYNPSAKHHNRNCTTACLIGSPLSLRKSAIVLKSGRRFSISQMASRLRAHSRSSFRDERTWFRCPQIYNPSNCRGSYPGRPGLRGSGPHKLQAARNPKPAINAAITRTGLASSTYSSSVLGNSTC